MSSGTCEFTPVDYKLVKPRRNKSVLTLSTSRNICCRDGENRDITPYDITPYDITRYDITPYDITPYDITRYDITPYDITPYDITPYDITRCEQLALIASVATTLGF